MPWALSLAFPRTGNRSEARIATMAMTTSNSIRVNALSRIFGQVELAFIGTTAAAYQTSKRGQLTSLPPSRCIANAHPTFYFAPDAPCKRPPHPAMNIYRLIGTLIFSLDLCLCPRVVIAAAIPEDF